MRVVVGMMVSMTGPEGGHAANVEQLNLCKPVIDTRIANFIKILFELVRRSKQRHARTSTHIMDLVRNIRSVGLNRGCI